MSPTIEAVVPSADQTSVTLALRSGLSTQSASASPDGAHIMFTTDCPGGSSTRRQFEPVATSRR